MRSLHSSHFRRTARARSITACTRGASIVEYLVILGLVALAGVVGFRLFGSATVGEVNELGVRVATLTSGGGGATGAGGGAGAPGECVGGVCTGDNCFVAGTPIATESGPRAIEEIRAGDHVLSRDEVTGKYQYRDVVRVYARVASGLVDVRVVSPEGFADTLRSTPEHPFFTRAHGWIGAGALTEDERVLDSRGEELRVVAVRPIAATEPVYNFEVDGTHTYFAGASTAWVHNVCGGTTPPGTPGTGHPTTVSTGSGSPPPGPTIVPGTVLGSYDGNHPGPLKPNLGDTFTGGHYDHVKLDHDTTLYRVYGGTAGQTGAFWSTKPLGRADATEQLAIKPEWGSTGERIATATIPAGTEVYVGTAAPQTTSTGRVLSGGGEQVVVFGSQPGWVTSDVPSNP